MSLNSPFLSPTVAKRWLSTNGREQGLGGLVNDDPSAKTTTSTIESSNVKTSPTPEPEPSAVGVGTLASRSAAAAYVGDQLSVVAIALLTALLLLAPTLVQRIRERGDDYESSFDLFSAEDPIDYLNRELDLLLAEEGCQDGSDNEADQSSTGSRNRQNVVEHMLRDVFQSQALQQAAQQFVVSTLQSEPVRQALQRLLKELALDLLQDKETVAQVVKLLHFAIQTKEVRDAAQNLVLDIIDDPSVKEALIAVVQRLGREPAVQIATQTLLSDSTHAVLNDEDILDHSMEFATDVLGDDIVQQTAGEALRNTVGHAVRPAATTTLWVAAGLSWIAVAILALGYANSNASASRMIHSSTSRSTSVSRVSQLPGKLVELLLWPFRVLGQAIWMPIAFVGESVHRMTSFSVRYVTAIPERVLQSVSAHLTSLSATIAQSSFRLLAAVGATSRNLASTLWSWCTCTASYYWTECANRVSEFGTSLASLTERIVQDRGGSHIQSVVQPVTTFLNGAYGWLLHWASFFEAFLFRSDESRSDLAPKPNGHV